MPAIRPEVFHVFRMEKTLSQASDTTAKSLKRKRQMERVRSLSLEDRQEALTETHLQTRCMLRKCCRITF